MNRRKINKADISDDAVITTAIANLETVAIADLHKLGVESSSVALQAGIERRIQEHLDGESVPSAKFSN